MRSIFALLLLSLASSRAHACSCLPPPPVIERAEQSTATFVGRLVSEEVDEWKRIYRLEIIESLHGEFVGIVEVSTAKDGAACGVYIAPDADYLIFCHSDDERLWTTLCSGNNRTDTDKGAAELAVLRQHTVNASNTQN